jgi:hypothetical protein
MPKNRFAKVWKHILLPILYNIKVNSCHEVDQQNAIVQIEKIS